MTVSTTLRLAGPFAGNGVTVQFPYAFKVFATSELLVVSSTGGVESTLMLGVDYTATLNADQDSAPGGAITLAVAPAIGKTLVITSNVSATQLTLVTNAGGFFPKIFNGVFDKLTILVQQLAGTVSRAFVVPITYTGSAVLPVTPSGVLQWAADGLSLTAVTLPDLSLSLALPSQTGHANHALYSSGVAAGWRAPLVSDITELRGTLNYLTAAVGLSASLSYVNAQSAQVASASAAAAAAQATQNAFLLNAAAIF